MSIDNLNKLITRKLKEFPNWIRVAGFALPEVGWKLDRTADFMIRPYAIPDRSAWEHRLKWWQKLAPHEVNEIIKAVNQIDNPILRQYLAIYYLEPPKYPPFGSNDHKRIRPKWPEVRKKLGLRSTVTRKEIDLEALQAFAACYRDGWLKKYASDCKNS